MSLLKPNVVYIRVCKTHIVATDYATKLSYEMKSFVTLKHGRSIVWRIRVHSYGDEIAKREVLGKHVEPFFGEYGFVTDPLVATYALNHCLKELRRKTHHYYSKPRIVLHFVYDADEEVKDKNFVEKNINAEHFKELIDGLEVKVVYLKYGLEDHAFDELAKHILEQNFISKLLYR